MSTAQRLISGSMASWVRIGITTLTQIALVPLFLTYWDVKIYGIWIAIQALVNILSIIDRGYVDYLGYEFLKAGKDNKYNISLDLWSGFLIIIFTGIIQFLVVYFFAFSKYFFVILGEDNNVKLNVHFQASCTFLLLWIGWACCANTTGLFFRALTVFGYYPRMAWWDTIIALFNTIISVLIVIFGGSLLDVGIGTTIFLFVITIPRFYDIYKFLKKEELTFVCISINRGLRKYALSFILSARYFLENFRQQGIRLILAPLVGLTFLAAFSTMKTAANVVQQGLLTITNPLLPELMRFLNNKEQIKMEASFGTVWLVLLCLLSPGVVILQVVAPQLFYVWTNGQIIFNPLLFALLSISVLIYAYSQPSIAIIVGNNLVKIQIIISFAVCILLLLGIYLLLRIYGITSIGLVLCVVELIASLAYYKFARIWLKQNGLIWPFPQSRVIIFNLIVISFCCLLIAEFPENSILFLALTFCMWLFSVVKYWALIPSFAKDKILGVVNVFIVKLKIFLK